MAKSFSVMAAAARMAMAGAGVFGREFRHHAFAHQVQIFLDGSLQRSEHSHSLGLKFHQGTQADATNDYAVHLAAAQGQQRLTHAVSVVQVAIGNFFDLQGIGIHYDKPGSRSKMTIDLAFKTFKCRRRKTDFHLLVASSN
jgi:hypothetical protein